MASWIRTFFAAVRQLAPTIPTLIAQRQSAPLNWDGTSIRDHLTEQDWKSYDAEISEQIDRKNDRAVAIISAAMVEDRLQWLIEAKFIAGLSSTRRERLFGGFGPLATFSSKIEIAYALGVIGEQVHGQLRQIGRIRNKFAHEFRRLRFADPEIAKLIDELRQYDRDKWANETNPMRIYHLACLICMTTLFATGQLLLASRDGASCQH